MTNQNQSNSEITAEKVTRLVQACEQADPAFFSLGTPAVGPDENTQAIIDLGTAAVEPLLDLLPTVQPHGAACIAYCLGQLGDRRAAPLLTETLGIYQSKTEKSPYDFAFIGNARIALSNLLG